MSHYFGTYSWQRPSLWICTSWLYWRKWAAVQLHWQLHQMNSYKHPRLLTWLQITHSRVSQSKKVRLIGCLGRTKNGRNLWPKWPLFWMKKTSTDLGIIEEVHHQIDDSGTSKWISKNSRFLKIKTHRDIRVLKSPWKNRKYRTSYLFGHHVNHSWDEFKSIMLDNCISTENKYIWHMDSKCVGSKFLCGFRPPTQNSMIQG